MKWMNWRSILLGLILVLLAVSHAVSNPSDPVTTLFSFPCDSSGVCPDGYFPYSLLESPDGNFYGVAAAGGMGTNAQGTVFQFSPATGQLSVIYTLQARRSCIHLTQGTSRTGPDRMDSCKPVMAISTGPRRPAHRTVPSTPSSSLILPAAPTRFCMASPTRMSPRVASR